MKFVKFWIAGIIGMAVSVSLLSCGGDDSDPGSVGNDESALSGDKGFMEQTPACCSTSSMRRIRGK